VKNYTVYCEYRECEVVDMFSKAKNFLNGLMAYVTIKQ
jgi:hypothetical protein